METITSGSKNLLGTVSSDGKRNLNTKHPTALLLGQVGVGKTLIYNKLCNTQHSTKYNRSSFTFEIRLNDVSYGNN